MTLDVGTYYLSESSSLVVPIYRNDSWFANGILANAKKGTFKVTEKDEYSARITVQAKATVLSDSLMCSTLENAEYEPYTGGKPSPSPEYPQEIESAGLDGEIAINVGGGNLLPCEYEETVTLLKTYKFANPLPPGVYCVSVKSISGEPSDGGYQFGMEYEDGTAIYGKITNVGGRDVIFPRKRVVSFIMYSNKAYPESLGKTTVYTGLMVNIGTTSLPYEPYKIPHTLIIPTSKGLTGIPVTSNGNYSDKNGQQWICDEIDLARGKYIQRIWKKTFDGSEDWKLYLSKGYEGFYLNALPEIMNNRKMYCNIYQIYNDGSIARKEGILMGANNYNIYAAMNRFYDSLLEDKGLANWKAFLAQNPMEIVTYITTPIETDLPPEVIEQYSHIHTYYPTTIISNDENAGMEVSYVADTKNYINQKIDTINAVLVNIQKALL